MNDDFPNYVNFYSSFDSPTKQELKRLLEQNGWASRKESRQDFELTNEWSEFNLLADETKPLLTGTIKDPENNYKALIDLFRNSKLNFQLNFMTKIKFSFTTTKQNESEHYRKPLFNNHNTILSVNFNNTLFN